MTWELQFQENLSDETHGLNDAGVEHYTDTPAIHVAREIGQNSNDVRADPSKPVVIRFNRQTIAVSEVPGWKKFRDNLNCCMKEAEESKDSKAIGFFKEALRLANEKTIEALIISDENTTGASGPCKKNRPFHTLLKGKGSSQKKDEASGGSYGIGKNAVFAISSFRTAFYSTSYRENEKQKFLAMGKSLLTSFVDSEGISRTSVGYWGAARFLPFENADDVPQWLRRETQGTSIFSLGFKADEDWQYRMALALITNFFVAIHREDMEIHIDDGRIKLTKDTLAGYLRNKDVLSCAQSIGREDDLRYITNLYRCLVEVEATEEVFDIPSLGKVKLRLLMDEDFPKRLSLIRNGMVITETLEHFGHKLRSFPGYKNFVAIVEPVSKEGRVLIKELENARHDSLSAERLTNAKKRKNSEIAMKRLGVKIREAIKAKALSKPNKTEDVDELAKFFASEDHDHQPSTDSLDTNPESYTAKLKNRKRRRRVATVLRGRRRNPPKPGPKPNPVKPRSKQKPHKPNPLNRGKKPAKAPVAIEETRNVVVGVRKRKIWFTPRHNGTAILDLKATGLSSSVDLGISAASKGVVKDQRLVVPVKAGMREEIEVSLSEDYEGPVEVFLGQ